MVVRQQEDKQRKSLRAQKIQRKMEIQGYKEHLGHIV